MSEDIISVPEVTSEDIIKINDENFTESNVGIVTGSGSGIGRATTLALAENGLTVVATDIDQSGLEKTINRAEKLGVEDRIRTVEANLAKKEEMDDLVEAASEYGSIKFLANIAGIQIISPLDEFALEDFDIMYDVLLRAPFYLSKLVFPHIRKSPNGSGCIGNVSSVHGHYVTENKVAYNSFKFGIRGLSKSIAAEGNGDIWSFSVSPGPVKTPMVVNQVPDIAEQRGVTQREAIEDILLGTYQIDELLDPVDIANVFVYGFSDIGKHYTGGEFLLDGGTTSTY